MSEKNEETKSTEPIEETEKVENAKSKENKEKTENTKNNEAIEKEEKETKKEKKGKKGKVILILIIILLVIVVATGGGYFAYQYIEENKPIEQEWADTYYHYIKDTNEEGKSEDEKIQNNSEIGFIEVSDIDDPVMIVEYEKDDEDVLDVYYINEGKVSNVINLGEADIELLYDMNKKEYDWYTHTKTDTKDTYTKLSAQILGENKDKEEETEYSFEKDEKITVETVDGDTISISKFDTMFIETDAKIDTVDYHEDMTNKELKETIEKGVTQYKPEEELITEDIKNDVTEKENKVTEKQEEMQQAEEEKKKAEEEARKKAEEEAKKKAEEEAKGLKVGSHTLQYGTYISDVAGMDSTMYGTITLNPDKTFHIKANCEGGYPYEELDCDGTYEVTKVLNSFTYFDGIRFTTSTGVVFEHEVTQDNRFSDQWHGYDYSGN